MSQYQIYLDNGDGLRALWLPGVEELALADIHYKPSAGSAGTLSFTVPPTHPLKDQIHPLSTDLWLLKGGKRIFRGRYVGREEDFYRTGKLDCEGDLNFLVDSIQDPYEYTGGIAGFFEKMLTAHNGMVETRKQFKRGIVNVVDENNYINRSNSKYSTTAASLKDKLVETHGGFLRVRHEADGNYLDYVYDYGGTNSQVIRFGENLLDITKQVDATQIITALIPIGAEVEYTDELGETQTRLVDITSVNDGKKYIVNQAAVDRWGMIWGTYEWEDVTLPQNLKKKAEAYLEECAALPETMELTALDLSLIDVSVDELQVGYWTRVVSGPHEVSGLYMLYEADINISDPDKSKISLGGRASTLSGTTAKNQAEASRKVQQTAEAASEEINRKIENATTLITGGFGGYVVLDNIDPATGKKIHPWRILVMNAPTKETAQNIIQINQNGIGFSTTGINGPYRNAWTIDGNLVADFITSGTMLADRIRGGVLEVGGAGLGKDGSILVVSRDGINVIRIDQNGIGFSTSGVNGPYQNAWTIDGQLSADFVKTGSMLADRIRGGVLEVGGTGLGKDGIIRILSSSGVLLAQYDKDGVNIYRGRIASYADDGVSRSTMTDGSFKTWVGDNYLLYLGNGGYEGHGSSGSAVLWLDGSHGIQLDASNGKGTFRDIEATRDATVRGDLGVEGEVNISGRTRVTDSLEVSDDIFCNGDVWAGNISDMSARISALEQKVG